MQIKEQLFVRGYTLESVARLLAEASLAVYEDDERTALNIMKNWCDSVISIDFVKRDNAVAAIVEHPDFRIWTFRGTDDASDWLDNLDFELSPHKMFHKGFHEHYQKVGEGMCELHSILAEQRGIKPVYFTGHSLGGACATIAAIVDAYHIGRPPAALMVFGSPRVMTSMIKDSDERMGFPFYRFRRCGDIVPRLPPRALHFHHGGTGIYIDRKRRFHKDWEWWNRLIDRILGWKKSIRPVTGHNMFNYKLDLISWERWWIKNRRNHL